MGTVESFCSAPDQKPESFTTMDMSLHLDKRVSKIDQSKYENFLVVNGDIKDS